jgi:hypothetical protein
VASRFECPKIGSYKGSTWSFAVSVFGQAADSSPSFSGVPSSCVLSPTSLQHPYLAQVARINPDRLSRYLVDIVFQFLPRCRRIPRRTCQRPGYAKYAMLYLVGALPQAPKPRMVVCRFNIVRPQNLFFMLSKWDARFANAFAPAFQEIPASKPIKLQIGDHSITISTTILDPI